MCADVVYGRRLWGQLEREPKRFRTKSISTQLSHFRMFSASTEEIRLISRIHTKNYEYVNLVYEIENNAQWSRN